MLKNQHWIKADFAASGNGICPLFRKEFESVQKPEKALLEITGKGVYYAEIDGKRVGDFILAPGWTTYKKRLQVQTYDVTEFIQNGKNTLDVTLAEGWYHGRIIRQHDAAVRDTAWDAEIIACLTLTYADGKTEEIETDGSWMCGKSAVEFSDIYDGEIYDARIEPNEFVPVTVDTEAGTETLIPQEGEKIVEHEHLAPIAVITTPKGETVLDFGQNLTGYPAFSLPDAKAGEKLSLSFAEILDKDGNFYNENYRSAKCQYIYTCKDGAQSYKPRLTFYGFRYIRIDEFPASVPFSPDDFTAIAVYSDIKKTGTLISSDKNLNQLFSNIFWGQKCNFLDVPTDCPQRDERLGWTGDAEVFAKTATYNFDTERFYKKWMGDIAAEIDMNGKIGMIVPNNFGGTISAEAWSDAAIIIPWQVYLTYGDKALLEQQLASMTTFMETVLKEGYNHHFGDWLGIDAPAGSYTGSTRTELIAQAFLAYDLELLAKAYEVLGRDGSRYRVLHEEAKNKFHADFSDEYRTQTEHVLALYFGLAENPAKTAKGLADLIHESGDHLTTGFVGTPFLLHALSDNGYTELAYTLLLQTSYPSWLFSVSLGATTMWEHWDGINENGDVWSKDMNSFNHYAYGAVGDWVYGKACGIQIPEDGAGFAKVRVAPLPDKRIGSLFASIDTRHGTVSSKWYHKDGKTRYEITVPVQAELVIDGKTHSVPAGTYLF